MIYTKMTSIKTPKNMYGCSRKGYYRNQVPINKVLLIIIMVLAYASQLYVPSTATGRHAGGQRTDCWRSVTCAQCAVRPPCSWSLKRQACAVTSKTSGSLRVHEPTACPSIAAVNRFVAADDATYVYALRVRNAPHGFAEFLAQAGIRCDVAGERLDGRVTEDRIECAATPAAGLWRRRADDGTGKKDVDDGGEDDGDDGDDDDDANVTVRHARVTFAGGRVTLRPDHVGDGYFAVSRHADCGRGSWDAACVTCARHDTAGTEYFVRCAGRNRCTGLFEYRDAWPPRPRRRQRTDARAADEDAPLSCGRDVRVLSVEPAAAPWTGGAALRVTVGDRGVLAEKAAVSVTVAGRPCAEPKVVPGTDAGAPSVITCTLPAAAAADGPDGGTAAAVRVRYQLKRTLELVAADGPFRYAYPEIAAVERAVRFGPGTDGSAAAGGAEWTVRGALLEDARRVYVGAGDVGCEPVARPSPDRLVCRAAAADGARDADRRLVVEFGGGLRVHAVLGPRWTVYVGEPAVDAGQTFRALASGDTALSVRGRRLTYATRVRFYAAGGRGACRVLNDTYAACAAPQLDGGGGGGGVTTEDDVGLLMDFAGRADFRAPAAAASYRAYPDPVFADFETDAASGTITVHGGGPGVGYTADDLTVRYSVDVIGGGGDGEERCDVIDARADRIVCLSTAPAEVLERARSVVVRVGDRLRARVAVARKAADGDGTAAETDFAHAHWWTVLALALAAVLAGAAAQVCMMRRRARMREQRKAAEADAGDRKDSDCSVRLTSSPCSSIDLTI